MRRSDARGGGGKDGIGGGRFESWKCGVGGGGYEEELRANVFRPRAAEDVRAVAGDWIRSVKVKDLDGVGNGVGGRGDGVGRVCTESLVPVLFGAGLQAAEGRFAQERGLPFTASREDVGCRSDWMRRAWFCGFGILETGGKGNGMGGEVEG